MVGVKLIKRCGCKLCSAVEAAGSVIGMLLMHVVSLDDHVPRHVVNKVGTSG